MCSQILSSQEIIFHLFLMRFTTLQWPHSLLVSFIFKYANNRFEKHLFSLDAGAGLNSTHCDCRLNFFTLHSTLTETSSLCARSACQIYDTIYGDFYENLAGIPQHRYTLSGGGGGGADSWERMQTPSSFLRRAPFPLSGACHCFPFCIPTVPSAAALLPFIENCCKRAHEMNAHKKSALWNCVCWFISPFPLSKYIANKHSVELGAQNARIAYNTMTKWEEFVLCFDWNGIPIHTCNNSSVRLK